MQKQKPKDFKLGWHKPGTKQKYWGYFHKNGSTRMLMFNHQSEVDAMEDSPNCLKIVQPFEANSPEDARTQLAKIRAKEKIRGLI